MVLVGTLERSAEKPRVLADVEIGFSGKLFRGILRQSGSAELGEQNGGNLTNLLSLGKVGQLTDSLG